MKKVKIIALSDTHGLLPDLPECDLILHAGDFLPVENHSIKYQNDWLYNKFHPWLKSLKYGCYIQVPGNHDLLFEEKPELIPNNFPCQFLIDQSFEFKGLKIYGTPWQPFFGDWAFNAYEEQLKEKWEMIPEGIDILVLHGPPYGYGDMVYSISKGDARNTGSPSLLEKIKKVKPKWVIAGHIHESYGISHLEIDGEKVTIGNVSVLDGNYNLANKPIIFEL